MSDFRPKIIIQNTPTELDELRAEVHRAYAAVEQLQHELATAQRELSVAQSFHKVAVAQRSAAWASCQRAGETLAKIYGLLYPPPVRAGDKEFRLHLPEDDANEWMRRMSQAIREIVTKPQENQNAG